MPGDQPPKHEHEADNVVPFPAPGREAGTEANKAGDDHTAARAAADALLDGLYGSIGKARLEADLAAIDDPAVFRRRFWFVANETRRRMILKFQRRADLTDGELTLLHYTSTLDLEDETPHITARRELWLFGNALAVFFALLATLAFLHVLQQPTRSWGQFLPLACVELVLAGLIHGSQVWWARPWTLRCRVERHLAKSA